MLSKKILGAIERRQSTSTANKILAKVEMLPALPGVVREVLDLTTNPDFPMDRLVQVVSLDPGITANVIRRVNSAYFGLRHKATSLEQAIPLVGANNLVEITLSSGVSGMLNGNYEGYKLSQGQLWRHSMATALASKHLSDLVEFEDSPTVFTAALLHDVGKAILSEFVKELFDEIDRLVSWEGWPLSEAENAVIGVDHTVLGGAAAKKWNLGEPIAVAVAYHHKPENAPSHRTITNLVAMANFFAATAGEGSGLGEEMPLIPKTASFELDIYPREVETITEQIVQMLNTSQDLLSLVD